MPPLETTRSGRFTSNFMRAAALARTFGLPLFSHCALALHVYACHGADVALRLERLHNRQYIKRRQFNSAAQFVRGCPPPAPLRTGPSLDAQEANVREYPL